MSSSNKIIAGKYEVLSKLSEGGMGEVFKARHLLLDEVFVLKQVRPQLVDKEKHEQRFLREARTAIRLKHPNIAGIHDFFTTEGQAVLVMEFIDGRTLNEILENSGPPRLGLAFEMARQTLEALSYLHGQGFLHRDISPDNLMLTQNFDGLPWIKLLDMGLAKSLGAGGDLTSRGTFLGKARYSAPERLSGQQDLDETSDLYSFGVTFYELFTGHYPIRGKDFGSLISGHLLQAPRGFEETDPEGRVPESLRALLLQCLEKRPEDRFTCARDLLNQLEEIEVEPVPASEVEGLFGVEADAGAGVPEPTVDLEVTADESGALVLKAPVDDTEIPPTVGFEEEAEAKGLRGWMGRARRLMGSDE